MKPGSDAGLFCCPRLRDPQTGSGRRLRLPSFDGSDFRILEIVADFYVILGRVGEEALTLISICLVATGSGPV